MQFAKLMGAQVAVTSSNNDKLQRARSLGADFTVNYRTHPEWSKSIWEWTNRQGVDHVIEVGGPGSLEQSMKAVAAEGHI
jgi:NADPH:quinone reductase-like Zn-dependent oxidoreductase